MRTDHIGGGAAHSGTLSSLPAPDVATAAYDRIPAPTWPLGMAVAVFLVHLAVVEGHARTVREPCGSYSVASARNGLTRAARRAGR
jgi:hypothetical protein